MWSYEEFFNLYCFGQAVLCQVAQLKNSSLFLTNKEDMFVGRDGDNINKR
jgi:hypothetical protein